MTYYQVEFQAVAESRLQRKRFRTEEKAKKHARKILGITESDSLEARAAIVPVPRRRTPIQ